MSPDIKISNMQTRIATEDTASLRQNQQPVEKKGERLGNQDELKFPSNQLIEEKVGRALELLEAGRNIGRGSIVNILA